MEFNKIFTYHSNEQDTAMQATAWSSELHEKFYPCFFLKAKKRAMMHFIQIR